MRTNRYDARTRLLVVIRPVSESDAANEMLSVNSVQVVRRTERQRHLKS